MAFEKLEHLAERAPTWLNLIFSVLWGIAAFITGLATGSDALRSLGYGLLGLFFGYVFLFLFARILRYVLVAVIIGAAILGFYLAFRTQ